MGLPYQFISPLGESTLFCVSRGATIQTLDLQAPSQILSSWIHPASTTIVEEGSIDISDAIAEEGQPPSKRRKVDSEIAPDTESGQGAADITGKKGSKKNRTQGPNKPEEPFVILLAATEDGTHVVAVTGQDKTLWVFEHDGRGSLTELSQRVMPKRPSSLAFTADGQTILNGDKFGDVYAIPLLVPSPPPPGTAENKDSTLPPPPASNGSTAAPSASDGSTITPPTTSSQNAVRGANKFTVHSGQNLRALEHQIRQREKNLQQDQPKEGPSFAHDLLLGHVSLLTCLVTARDGKGRPYIITADRDEHIRVSRGMPQAHVIETYCLGHASFVNALCLPRPEILVSGGGDGELFVWDWLAGKLLGTIDLLVRVQEISPDASKLAVKKLHEYEVEGGCYVGVICERIPALFTFQLERNGNALSHLQTLKLPGNPLDVAILNIVDANMPQPLLVSIDSDSESLLVLERKGNIWSLQSSIVSEATQTHRLPTMSREDLDKILYTTENLRKSDMETTANAEDETAPGDA